MGPKRVHPTKSAKQASQRITAPSYHSSRRAARRAHTPSPAWSNIVQFPKKSRGPGAKAAHFGKNVQRQLPAKFGKKAA
jgi:hypothetical protein